MLTIDFETVDPYITLGFGAGWVFALNHGKEDFKLLGASIKESANHETVYVTDLEHLKDVVLDHHELVMHNAAYDVGCLMVLFKDDPRFVLRDYTIYDTMIMAKLHNQDFFSYSLANLGTQFELPVVKNSSLLWDYAWDTGIYQAHIKETRDINKHTRPTDSVMDKFCKTHMDLFPVDLVGMYANYDVDATHSLYQYLIPHLEEVDLEIYSDLIKLCIEVKARGINIDLAAAKSAHEKLGNIIEEKTKQLFNVCKVEFNTNSVQQVISAFKKIGITGFNITSKGNESIGDGWLEEQTHPACVLLTEVRKITKIRDSFVAKAIDYQEMTGLADKDVGIIYPSFHVLGATKTGRFTSGAYSAGSYEMNMQQIPARDPVLGPICRSLFIPPEGKVWITADYSNQEQRLQVHYASSWRLKGVEEVVLAWNQDHDMDYHSKVASMVGFLCSKECGECKKCKQGRTYAKTINLGLSYGMGGGKLCTSLGLPTEYWKTPDGNNVLVAGKEGKALLDQYHSMFPFMKKLQDSASSMLNNRGFVETIGGRRLNKEPVGDPKGRKGLSKLIQGSAADQVMKALQNAYKAGLEVRATVHDEICLTSKDSDKDVKLLQECMTNTYETHVPMVADIGIGKSWAETK